METLRIILAWAILLIFAPLYIIMATIEMAILINNDLTKDKFNCINDIEKMATYKLFIRILNKITG